MKKVPMILLLIAPYLILLLCSQLNMDLRIGLYIYSFLLVFNIVYAFLLPRMGFRAKQLLLWNLLLKLSHIPLTILIFIFTLVMVMVGGQNASNTLPSLILIALLFCWLLQLSSAMFGISGFRWCHKNGTLSKAGLVASAIAQFIPCVDVVGSILCYIMFRKDEPRT